MSTCGLCTFWHSGRRVVGLCTQRLVSLREMWAITLRVCMCVFACVDTDVHCGHILTVCVVGALGVCCLLSPYEAGIELRSSSLVACSCIHWVISLDHIQVFIIVHNVFALEYYFKGEMALGRYHSFNVSLKNSCPGLNSQVCVTGIWKQNFGKMIEMRWGHEYRAIVMSLVTLYETKVTWSSKSLSHHAMPFSTLQHHRKTPIRW